MPYYTILYTPETFEGFTKSSQDLAGFPKSQAKTLTKVQVGDVLIGYMTRLSRWVGALRVVGEPFEDDTPIFMAENDRFVLRVPVEPIVWLPKELAVPIHESAVWDHLSFTRELAKNDVRWTGKVRRSLVELSAQDAEHLLGVLQLQQADGVEHPVDEDAYRRWLPASVKTSSGTVSVVVPDELSDNGEVEETVGGEAPESQREIRRSYQVQAQLAHIGETMGFKIWLPRNDRSNVLDAWQPGPGTLVEHLPLNYDDVTLRTIELIDVLWLKGRSIVRAFEVEHTTSVYSGILRMADLLALQPNMDIKLHIVAPDERRDRVLGQIKRPVFSLLDRGPLGDYCTFISYDSLSDLAANQHLAHLSDSVLEEYIEESG